MVYSENLSFHLVEFVHFLSVISDLMGRITWFNFPWPKHVGISFDGLFRVQSIQFLQIHLLLMKFAYRFLFTCLKINEGFTFWIGNFFTFVWNGFCSESYFKLGNFKKFCSYLAGPDNIDLRLWHTFRSFWGG